MSGHNYISNSASLFDEDNDDVDDETFLKNNSRNDHRTTNTNPFVTHHQQQQHQTCEDRRTQIENRTLDSSYRSIGLLRDTEQIGISTAEELTRQREQLEKTSKQLDDINTTLRFSQKHINGLKSVFGGLKNYLSGQKDLNQRLATSGSVDGSSSSKFSDRSEIGSERMEVQTHTADHMQQYSRKSGCKLSSSTFNEQLDRNLDEMAGNLSRLKGLAIDLNQDIELQNDLIDSIGNKVDDVDIKIKRQNKEMNHLLGKK